MAGDCTYTMHYTDDDTFPPSKHLRDVRVLQGEAAAARPKGRESVGCSSNFEIIDGLQYRKKLERGFIHYREVLDEDRRLGAIATFHRRRHGTRHHSLDDTYRSVADNYWWEGMYFQIRDFVLGCPECLEQRNKRPEREDERRLSKTMMTHGRDVLNKLRSQREAGLFCDVTLRTDGCSYSAHKAVLAAVSEYFHEVFTEMDSNPGTKSDIDLTGYSESSLVSLLDFSYSSILCVSEEELQEVSTMARHLGMWPAVDACLALQRDQGNHTHCPTTEHRVLGFAPQSPGSPRDLHHHHHRQQMDRKTGVKESEDCARPIRDQCRESREDILNRRSPRRPPGPSFHPPGQNSLTASPTCRMKLMDFKSPSLKKRTPPRKITPTTPRSRNTSPSTHTRLLRSTPGAAQKVQRLLPRTGSPPRGQKLRPALRPASTSCSPRQRAGSEATTVVVKEEEEEGEEDEKDHFRALEKYRLMSVLGLQRTSLLPRPEDLIGWRQKKRLRKLKVNNYSLTKRRKPRLQIPGGLAFGGIPLSLPLCTPANAQFLKRVIKTEPEDPVSMQEMTLKRRRQPRRFPPSDRSMRSKVTLPDLQEPESRKPYGGRDLRRSVRVDEFSRSRPGLPPFSGNSRVPNPKRNVSTVQIKPQPVDYAISPSPLPTQGAHSNTCTHPTRAHPRDRVTIEPVRVLRYNSGRQFAKAKLGRIGRKEAGRAQRKSREEIGRKGSSEGARSVTEGEPGALSSRNTIPDPVSPLHSPALYRVIKEEPTDPLPVAEPFPEPPSPELGKRQSKPPVKLLDPGFLFSFCRPAGGPMVGVKREEESVDICLTRSVSRGERFGPGGTPARVLRARGGPTPLPRVKSEREQRSVSHSQSPRQGPPRLVNSPQRNTAHSVRATGSKAAGTARDIPKKQVKTLLLASRGPTQLDSIRRARLKQLRGPRSQAPKAKSSHVCLQCRASYKDCYALITHRIRHIEGKHWPCPLCSKTFFRMRNVKNHIRTHDQKLYKCRSCMTAS
ncbi:uncharacterized protein si:dkey-229b18.3 isoform X2 [Esox lucius]|uniref:uncharacterized protein si:dkey-229b18.3 isoform X2 n=1 Tax=Esox lucius TaxID=8010 RepID=UPI0014774F2D|nr:uncharacterized protein si:dkey-229b18.3 isoform X2 [Esox lucius]